MWALLNNAIFTMEFTTFHQKISKCLWDTLPWERRDWGSYKGRLSNGRHNSSTPRKAISNCAQIRPGERL